ncbi:M23 family metallopeptidase [Altericista sp. CCNU0014]|uniref:M23 family metallopeptidase n=1 Tax=Altericista sp. CCNU0014 TaxID=3082949 RepID=UPI00384FC1E7
MSWFARSKRASFSKSLQRLHAALRLVGHRLKSTPSILSLSVIAIAVLSSVLVHPAQALLAKVSPTSPQLGDTITVTMQADGSGAAPQVRVGAKTYPAFSLNANLYRTLVPTTPLDKPGPLTVQVNNGTDTQAFKLNLKKRWFPTQSIWLRPGSDSNSDEYEFDRMDAFKAIVTPQKYWNGPFRKPNNGPVTTVYGVRRYYNGVFAKDYFHRGVDYAGAYGSAIVAPADGRVALVGREAKRFKVHGNCVGLDHGQGVSSVYLHLSRIDVKEGDFVKAGQTIGALGGTGAVTGPHLHWGLFVFGKSVDPGPWRNQGFN